MLSDAACDPCAQRLAPGASAPPNRMRPSVGEAHVRRNSRRAHRSVPPARAQSALYPIARITRDTAQGAAAACPFALRAFLPLARWKSTAAVCALSEPCARPSLRCCSPCPRPLCPRCPTSPSSRSQVRGPAQHVPAARPTAMAVRVTDFGCRPASPGDARPSPEYAPSQRPRPLPPITLSSRAPRARNPSAKAPRESPLETACVDREDRCVCGPPLPLRAHCGPRWHESGGAVPGSRCAGPEASASARPSSVAQTGAEC